MNLKKKITFYILFIILLISFTNITAYYFIYFKCSLKSEKVLVNNVKWIESMGDYVKIVTQNKNYVVLSSMKAFISRLPENQFVRIHKSYIINLKKVINHDSNNVFIDGKILPLSRNKKLIFKENFAKYQ